MKLFLQEIIADIDWRLSELAILKTLPIRYSFSPDHKDIHLKYSVPAIYAIWEGFVKNTFTIYSNYINSFDIKRNEISLPLLTHQLDSECDFDNPRIHFDSKQKLVKMIDELLCETITIKPNIPTESNVNFKVLSKILQRFCVDAISPDYENGLNKLLRFRNMIAHGENSIAVTLIQVTEFISLVENLMLDIAIQLEKSDDQKTYKRASTDD